MNALRIFDTHGEADSSVKNFLNVTLKQIMSVTHAECGSLFVFNPKQKELTLSSFYNSSYLNIKGIKRRIGEGVSGKVADLMVPVLVRDIDADSRFIRNGFAHYRTKSFISVPVFSVDGLLGLINVTDKTNGMPFSEDDLHAAVTISKYAWFAMEGLNDLRLEKEVLANQKALLEKYASVGKLAAGVVHEINNPLDGIIRFTNILLPQMEDNSVAREYLLEVKKGLERIANITKSLLIFSCQVNNNLTQPKKYLDLCHLIHESIGLFSDKIPANVSIKNNLSRELPRVLDLGFTHVAANLIKNGIDAMPEGGQLEIFSNLNERGIEISFKDTGKGMTDQVKEQIFEPFFTTKSPDKGTGLGLAICNEIVTKYEGMIKVESAPGKGSEFKVFIPRKHLENVQPS
ncbi:MAG: ATP-binding protein [Candidatus Omnitrophica bacterium]|nr:ATP-binding protein [Candidatus Omnitrophota bacterium]